MGDPADTEASAERRIAFAEGRIWLLIHLGYLAYREDTETVHIPNEEIRRKFAKIIRRLNLG